MNVIDERIIVQYNGEEIGTANLNYLEYHLKFGKRIARKYKDTTLHVVPNGKNLTNKTIFIDREFLKGIVIKEFNSAFIFHFQNRPTVEIIKSNIKNLTEQIGDFNYYANEASKKIKGDFLILVYNSVEKKAVNYQINLWETCPKNNNNNYFNIRKFAEQNSFRIYGGNISLEKCFELFDDWLLGQDPPKHMEFTNDFEQIKELTENKEKYQSSLF